MKNFEGSLNSIKKLTEDMNQWSSISGKAAPEIPMHILAIKSVNQKILGANSEMEGGNERIKVTNKSYENIYEQKIKFSNFVNFCRKNVQK